MTNSQQLQQALADNCELLQSIAWSFLIIDKND